VAETGHELLTEAGALFWNPRFHELRAENRASTGERLELLQSYFIRTRADAEHWVLPGRTTMADVIMAYALETLMPLHPGLVKDFPALHHAMTAFFATDRIRDYVRCDRRFRTWTVSLASFGGKPEETHHWID
jgi:hypothetical protein